MIKRCLTSLVATLMVCFLACSSASARVCFLPDSTDCGEGDVVGSGNVDVPCQYSSCPAYNSNYQECYDERTYNNAGVNVTCKQIRCKLSKSKCEELEDNPNSSQCCNFDSASGCYYMGKCPILCNRNIYDRTTDLSGEDYTCTSCKDKNGTFYNCTAKEKECKDINPDYTSKCGDSQIAKEVEGIKDSHGNQCYTCVDKPAGCTYEYRQATTADSCGLTDLNTNYQCMSRINGCMCYTQLQKVSSVDAGAGYVVPYNKISNKSATCVDEKGVTRYQTICQGTRKSSCNTRAGYEFKPNGCISDTYNNGFEVKGDEWGDCVKKEETCTYEYTHLTNDITYYTRGGLDGKTWRFGKKGPTCKDGDKRTIYESCGKYNNSNSYTCGKSGPSCNASEAGKTCKVTQECMHGSNCEVGTKCWDILSANESIEKGGMGYPSVVTIYNKISNKSASCTNPYNVIMYETLCEGTPRSKCNKKFTPNGCESDSYSIYSVYDNKQLNVVGDKFGDCGCDTSNGLYDTVEECEKANEGASLKCTGKGSCYQTCEAAGSYSTKEACKKASQKYTECKSDASNRCYVPIKKGWGIHYGANYEKAYDRTYICYDGNVPMDTDWTASVLVRNKNFTNSWKDAEDLNGDTYTYIHNAKGELRYPAGEYKINLGTRYERYMYVNRMTLSKGSGEYCIYEWNSHAGRYDFKTTGDFCSATVDSVGRNIIGILATFEEGEEYYVTASMSPNGYRCSLKKYVYPNH